MHKIFAANAPPRHISGKYESSNTKRYVHPNVHSSIIYNSQDMEAISVYINRWMDKEDVIYIYVHIHTHIYTVEYYSDVKKNEATLFDL